MLMGVSGRPLKLCAFGVLPLLLLAVEGGSGVRAGLAGAVSRVWRYGCVPAPLTGFAFGGVWLAVFRFMLRLCGEGGWSVWLFLVVCVVLPVVRGKRRGVALGAGEGGEFRC